MPDLSHVTVLSELVTLPPSGSATRPPTDARCGRPARVAARAATDAPRPDSRAGHDLWSAASVPHAASPDTAGGGDGHRRHEPPAARTSHRSGQPGGHDGHRYHRLATGRRLVGRCDAACPHVGDRVRVLGRVGVRQTTCSPPVRRDRAAVVEMPRRVEARVETLPDLGGCLRSGVDEGDRRGGADGDVAATPSRWSWTARSRPRARPSRPASRAGR